MADTFEFDKSEPDKVRVPFSEVCCIITRTLALISVYLALSIGIVFYQRWILEDLHFPFSMVLCHLSIKFVLAGVCRLLWETCTGKERVVLAWGPYIRNVGPTGIASGLDIGLSNWGLHLITVSLYTMTKSTAIIFILIFALLFKLEKKSWSLIFIVFAISNGLFLSTYKATEFNIEGFLLVLAASFASGLRWTLAQLLMQKSNLGLCNPLDMLYHVQPWMIIALLPLAVGIEGEQLISSCHVFRYTEFHVLASTIVRVLVGSLVAYAMEISEFMLVSHTSSLTLSVAGVCKDILTLVLAVEWAGDPISTMKFFGLLLCVGGISYHSYQKVRDVNGGHLERSREPVLLSGKKNKSAEEVHIPLLADINSSDTYSLTRGTNCNDDESDEDDKVIFHMINHSR